MGGAVFFSLSIAGDRSKGKPFFHTMEDIAFRKVAQALIVIYCEYYRYEPERLGDRVIKGSYF